MTPLVRCRAAGRAFGRGRAAHLAVHDVDCVVHDGQRIALTGPSGSGKSTLLHLLAGLDLPTAGVVEWPALGARFDLRPGPVAVVLQGPSLLPALDVRENVALPLVLGGCTAGDATARADRALDRLGLERLGSQLPEELSGGQAQRVAIARALAQTPRLLLADEPTGQLDHTTARAVIDALLDATAVSGAALVIATHDPAVADRLEHEWTIADGRLAAAPVAPAAPETPCSA